MQTTVQCTVNYTKAYMVVHHASRDLNFLVFLF